MQKILLFIPLAILLSCSGNPSDENANPQATDSTDVVDMHNSKSSVDWDGRYTGILPCADCEGIETVIYLSKDNTYAKRQIYLGKGVDPIEESGEFSWSEDGGKITLSADKMNYKVGENVLFTLDQSGNTVSGDLADNYRLHKAFADNNIENITWQLIQLDGKDLTSDDVDTKAYFVLNSSEGRVSGNMGCNNFFGTYKLETGMRIAFGQMGATMKACPDMSTEKRLSEIFEIADNYTVQNGTLSLNKARMAPLAVFKEVKK